MFTVTPNSDFCIFSPVGQLCSTWISFLHATLGNCLKSWNWDHGLTSLVSLSDISLILPSIHVLKTLINFEQYYNIYIEYTTFYLLR